MKLLLDTHIFLWYISGDPRLPAFMKDHIQNFDNEVYLSVVTLWEAIIKHQIGKLPLPQPPKNYLPKQREQHQIASLSINEACVTQLAALPLHHRDPFDRILICQAIEYNLVVATVDDVFRNYPVAILTST